MGRFITIEGGEGAGKSTAQTFLAEKLTAQGISVLQTREPGGTPLAEAIRRNLLSVDEEAPVEMAELLLVFAARENVSGFNSDRYHLLLKQQVDTENKYCCCLLHLFLFTQNCY